MGKPKNNNLKETIDSLKEINAEKEKRLSEFHSLIHSLINGIAFFEPVKDDKGEFKNCIFLDVNPAFEKITGTNKDVIIGKDIFFVFPALPKNVLDAFDEVLGDETPKMVEFYYESLKKFFLVDIGVFNGERNKFYTVFTDITEYKPVGYEKKEGIDPTDKELRIVSKKLRIGTQIIQVTNQRLKESELRFRALVENSPDMIFRYDKNYRHVYVSPNVLSILGKNPDDMIGKTHYELECSYTDSLMWREKMRKVFEEGVEEELEFFCKNNEGEDLFLSWKLAPEYRDEEKVVSVLGIARDITLRKKAEDDLLMAKEKAEEAEKLKSAFLANMSHEIRTPMNGILGFSELLTDDTLPEEKRKLFSKIINNNGKQLLRIIDDIIDVSKLEAGEVKIVKTKCSLNVLLDELFSLFNSDNKTKENIIELKLIKGLSDDESMIFIDEMRLRQVLINLIGNAVKFTTEGFVDFGYEPIKAKSELRFYIKDTGIGIPEEEKGIIFERFRQVDETVSKDYGGTGLGLPISKGFIDLMGGRIWMENNEEKGSIFYFTIPYRPVKKEQEVKKMSSELFNQNWEGKTIIVVEDEDSSFLFLETLLSITGVYLLHASNGQEAVELAENNKNVDLILMDIQLPILNGYEATKKIRSFNEKVPIIAQTAYALSGEKEKSLQAGCTDYLTKPINRYLLFEKLNKYLNS